MRQKRQNNKRRLPDPRQPRRAVAVETVPSIHIFNMRLLALAAPWFLPPYPLPPLCIHPSSSPSSYLPLLLFPSCSKKAAGQTTDGMDRGQKMRSNSLLTHKRNELVVIASNAALKIKENENGGWWYVEGDHKYSFPECARKNMNRKK